MNLPADLLAALLMLATTPRLLVASDFDGTLAPIVSRPADARPLPGGIAALVDLAALPDTSAALISGRALADLAVLSGVPATVSLVGSHGAEFPDGFGADIDTALLGRIIAELTAIAARFPGVTVETKPASAALHVRNATASDAAAALAAASDAGVGWTGAAHVTAGKAVLEFAVIDTDKGAALDILRERVTATAVVFFGDDVTDEKAFARLRPGRDVGVKVGPGDTAADYRVSHPEDVAAALQWLAATRAVQQCGPG